MDSGNKSIPVTNLFQAGPLRGICKVMGVWNGEGLEMEEGEEDT